MAFPPNDGKRQSLLDLGRIATGELEGELPPAYREAVEEARQKVPPFNAEILRSHAERIRQDEARAPVALPSPGRRWMWAAIPVLMAAIALFLVRPPDPEVRIKGGDEATLQWYFMDKGQPVIGAPDRVLKKGDQIQFRYGAGGRQNLVLISIDGAGTFTTFYPQQGEQPLPVTPLGEHVLQGSIILDAAPGPEVFIAVFGAETVKDAVTELEATWANGRLLTIKELDADRSDIAVNVLLRGD